MGTRQPGVEVQGLDVWQRAQHAQPGIPNRRVREVERRERGERPQVRHSGVAHGRVGEVQLSQAAHLPDVRQAGVHHLRARRRCGVGGGDNTRNVSKTNQVPRRVRCSSNEFF